MLMEGSSLARDSEHGKAVTAQLTRRHGTLEEAIDSANFALAAADISRGIRRQARAACEDYFYNRLGLSPGYEPPRLRDIPPGLEPLSEPMTKLLENIVEAVVDGEWEDLRELSNERLEEEDMRRRVEDDCPEALVLPPQKLYRVEVISKRDDAPDDQGWTYFLELWTEDGPATLHIEGTIEDIGGQLEATLTDILP
jgi:hypothetical protein